jgi:hypothetical protein
MPEDSVVAALDDDELQLGIQFAGELPPLSTSRLWSVNGIDDDVVSQRELLSGQGRHDEVRSVMGRRGRADSCAPHRPLSLIHPEYRAMQRSPEIGRHRGFASSRKPGHHDQHS